MLIQKGNLKMFRSENYNYTFNKENGYFERWGKTFEDDPQIAPFPEILDLEISTGECKGRCNFCYKLNGQPYKETKHMSLETFKEILKRFNPGLTQIALGLTNTTSNPDFWNILEECNKQSIIVNFTTHGLDITPEIAKRVSKLCGAAAVSIVNRDKSYNAVKLFTDEGMKQVNIHCMICKERLNFAHQLIDDIQTDERLKKLNAIVFLQYKPKGNNK